MFVLVYCIIKGSLKHARCQQTAPSRSRRDTCFVKLGGSFEEAGQRRLQHHDKVLQLLGYSDQHVLIHQVVLGLLQRPVTAHIPAETEISSVLCGFGCFPCCLVLVQNAYENRETENLGGEERRDGAEQRHTAWQKRDGEASAAEQQGSGRVERSEEGRGGRRMIK